MERRTLKMVRGRFLGLCFSRFLGLLMLSPFLLVMFMMSGFLVNESVMGVPAPLPGFKSDFWAFPKAKNSKNGYAIVLSFNCRTFGA
jgi:hypothetical protein